MNPQDRGKFGRYMTDVLAFHKQDASKFALDVWWHACQPFDLEQVRSALTAHTMDPERGNFPPMPADITRKLMGTKTDRARLAWSKTLDAMGGVGAYRSVVFDDPVIHAVVEDLGGWTKLCREDLTSFTEHRFCETYRAYASRTDMQFPAKLIGEHEATNRHEGQPVRPPVLIGNPEKAKQVLLIGSSGRKTQFTLASDVPSVALLGDAS